MTLHFNFQSLRVIRRVIEESSAQVVLSKTNLFVDYFSVLIIIFESMFKLPYKPPALGHIVMYETDMTILMACHFNTYTAKPVCWNGWISDSYCSLKPLCSGMGEVVPARTSPTLLPPSPRTVLSLSCFKVSQCINRCDWHCKS